MDDHHHVVTLQTLKEYLNESEINCLVRIPGKLRASLGYPRVGHDILREVIFF